MGRRLLDMLRWLLWGAATDPVEDGDDENVPEWSGHYSLEADDG